MSCLGSSLGLGFRKLIPVLPPFLAAGFEFDRWLNTPGWPPYLPDLSPGEQLMKPADELAELWAADSLNMEAIEAVDITAWRMYQLVYFLDQVLQKSPLPEGEGKVTSRGFCAQGRHEVMHPGPASWPGTGGHISGTCGCMAISPSPPRSSRAVPGVWEASVSVVRDGEPGQACP